MSGYWIIKGRSAVGRHIMKCIKCRELRGTPCSQKMADLPSERVDEAEPFSHTGVDCFGPFFVKKRRSKVKRWGILFTWLSSRAIHLETSWRRIQYLADQFWIRWRREFLSSLQERRKWHHPEPNIGRDDVVVVVDDDAPRNRWPLARVAGTYPGADGLVRSVRVRIGNSEYDRPIHKLILLVKSGDGDSASRSHSAD